MSIFTNHPKKVCMTYFEHFKLSMTLSIHFFEASTKAFVHAIFPFWFPSESTRINQLIGNKIKNSGCQAKNNK